ncbi:MAG: glycoside hydrolase family 3 protein [Cyclobacteriaceae bacterium]|nr:glycoside hydrolase family 3 protein [Cyclobacteriaceae bacterium]
MITKIKFSLIALFIFSASFSFAQVDSLDIKIGQMILVGVAEQQLDSSSTILQEIRDGKIGGAILFEKNITPQNAYINLKKLTYELQSAATIPLFIAIDQEGGRVNRLKTKYQFPKSVTSEYLGTLDNIDSTKFYGQITASTLAGLGFNVNFAPVVDLAINPDNPIIAKYGRAFSADASLTAKHASIIVAQHRKYGVVTVLKHFPGHGSSKADTHLGIADVTEYWQEEELKPYQIMIDNGMIDAIMTAHIVNKKIDKKGNPGTLSKKVIDDLLRKKMGHEGVVFTDDLQMHAITKHYGFEKSIELTIKAGVDVMIFSNNIQGSDDRTVDAVYKVVKKLIADGEISEARIDESYQRIMKLKKERLL